MIMILKKGIVLMQAKFSKKFFIIALISVCILMPCFSDDETDRWFWPLGEESGEIIMRPGRIMNPVSDEAFDNYDYFISGTEGLPVYSPVDGYISNTSSYKLVYPDALHSWSFSSMDEFYAMKEQISDVWLQEKNLTKSIAIVSSPDNRPVYISGFSSNAVKKGQRIQKGEYLGDMGYIRTFSERPCISISSPDVGKYLLGEDNSNIFAGRPKAVEFDPKSTIPLSVMQEAAGIFSSSILEDHPALLDSSLIDSFKKAVQDLNASLYEGMPALDFLYQLRLAASKLHCVHTVIEQKGTALCMLEWPLNLVFHDNKAYVVNDRRGNLDISSGTCVLSINGHAIKDLLEKQTSVIPADTLSAQVLPDIASSYWINRVISLLKFPDIYEYRLLMNDSSERIVSIPRLNPRELNYDILYPEWYKTTPASYEVLNPSTAVIRLKTIDKSADQDQVTGWFKDLAEKSITNLIVDLRGNRGGDIKNAAFFFSYLAEQPFKDESYSEIRHPGQYESLRHSENMIYFENGSYPPEFADYQKPDDGRYIKWGGEEFEPAAEYNFSGNVYVLVDCITASAAVWLGRKIAEQGAITIGSETGGGFYECNAVKINRVRLGETGLVLYLPLIYTVFSDNMDSLGVPPHRGLIPQYQVSASLEDKLYGTDSVLDFTLDLIANPPSSTEEKPQITGTGLVLLLAAGLCTAAVITVIFFRKRKLLNEAV